GNYGCACVPERYQLFFRSVESIAIAASHTIDFMWQWSRSAVRVLPERPPRPDRRNQSPRSVLRNPQPAVRQHGLLRIANASGTQHFLDRMAGVEAWKAPGPLENVVHELLGFFQRHVEALRIAFQVQHQERVGAGDVE